MGFLYRVAAVALSAVIGGCALHEYEQRPSWRADAEAQCLRNNEVTLSSYFEPAQPIGRGQLCGISRPLEVSAFAGGAVELGPTATLNCPITAAVDAWIKDAVLPASYAYFGEPVVKVTNAADYACRTRNHKKGAKMSEHSFGNALDISAFELESGRRVTISKGWRGKADERGFLRDVLSQACGPFTTVLGPGSDGYHEAHFHMDLARHSSSGYVYCRPKLDADKIASNRPAPQTQDRQRVGQRFPALMRGRGPTDHGSSEPALAATHGAFAADQTLSVPDRPLSAPSAGTPLLLNSSPIIPKAAVGAGSLY